MAQTGSHVRNPTGKGGFQKGFSANPGGRPKITLADGRSLRDLAREHTEEAVRTLVEALGAAEANVRVSAATALLDRGWGRPTQAIEHSGDVGVSLVEIIAQRRAHVTRELAMK